MQDDLNYIPYNQATTAYGKLRLKMNERTNRLCILM